MVLITNTDYTFRDVLAVTSDRVRDLRSRSRSTAIAFGITIGIWIEIEIEIVQSIGIAIGKRVSTEIAIAIVFPLWALLDLDPDRNSNCPIEIQKFWISIGQSIGIGHFGHYIVVLKLLNCYIHIVWTFLYRLM